MKPSAALCLVLASLLAVQGCRTKVDKDRERDLKLAAAEAETKVKIPPDSPLASVKFGMTEAEVDAILGPPDAQENHATNRPYVPSATGSKEGLRTVKFYKAVGRVGFSSGSWGQRNGVVLVEYDPDEPGNRRKL